MFSYPKTLEEAEKIRYGQWGGNPKGYAYKGTQCAEEVCSGDRAVTFYQCSRAPGYGPAKLYCKQHGVGKSTEDAVTVLWYEVSSWRSTITAVKVLSETPHCLVLPSTSGNGYRVAKGSVYYRTFKEAREFLLNRLESKRCRAHEESEKAKKEWDEVFRKEGPDKE